MTYLEIISLIQRNTNTQSATTSSYPLADKTLDINNALNHYFIIANKAAGNWRPVDDTNQTDYPIIFTDLIQGQQDISFTLDQNGNQILNVYKVRILNPNGITWTTLDQIDVDRTDDLFLNPTTTGVPQGYYMTANGIFLVNPPNYNMRLIQEGKSGIEIYVSRTSTYFTVLDTTKKAGMPWVFHEYLALRPSYLFCLTSDPALAAQYGLLLHGNDGQGGMEKDIKDYYRDRNPSFSPVITSERVNPV